MTRPLVHPLVAVLIFMTLALIAVLFTSAVIDGLASSRPSVTISIVSPTPASPSTP